MLLWLFVALACARPSPPAASAADPPSAPAPVAVDCCTCQMWGVTGIDPGPDWEPPPLPEACHEVLEDPSCTALLCPAPP